MDAATPLLRLAFLVCAVATGTAVVRNCTDSLEGIAYGIVTSGPSAQPVK